MTHSMKLLIFAFTAACSFAWGVQGSADDVVTKYLKAPDLSESQVIGYNVGLRPYRKTGIRLEAQYFKDKLIVHNYGHGGAGLTLSWGSAHEAVELMQLEVIAGMFFLEYDEVSIIGSGVIGLTTANILLDKGYKVNVYASEFPPSTTSNVAGGVWIPAGVAIGHSHHDKSLFQKILKRSYKEFKSLAESHSPAYRGISKIDLYNFNPSKNGLDLAQGLIPPGVPIDVSFDNGILRSGVSYETFLIDADIYIQDLYANALKKGAVFEQKTFTNPDELLELDEVIFNCAGLGSGALFNDPDVVPARGQLVYLAPQAGMDYVAAGRNPGSTNDFYIIPLKDKIAVGGTWDLGQDSLDVDPVSFQKILLNAQAFFAP